MSEAHDLALARASLARVSASEPMTGTLLGRGGGRAVVAYDIANPSAPHIATWCWALVEHVARPMGGSFTRILGVFTGSESGENDLEAAYYGHASTLAATGFADVDRQRVRYDG